jgi:galactokinase
MSAEGGSRPEARAVAAFLEAFGVDAVSLWQAPGRVNLIGEHTDYNDGFVLPCAIDRRTAVACGPGESGIEVFAADPGERDAFAPTLPIAHGGDWKDYVRGVAAELLKAGHALPPARLAIAGDVPLGSGLSSSAAIEVATALALLRPRLHPRAGGGPGSSGSVSGDSVRQLSASQLDPRLRGGGEGSRGGGGASKLDLQAIALLCQRAENHFVGVASGIMDQLVSACAVEGHALMIDCRSLERTPVPLPDGSALLVVESGVRHANNDGGYNRRREECERAARHYGVAKLRDLDEAGLGARRAGLDDVAYRRARHVVTENARVLAAADALRQGDLAEMGRLMAASHASMRDDFEITVPEIDRIVEAGAAAIGERGGIRMTGGGFGGSVVALVPEGQVDAVRDAIRAACRTPAGEPVPVTVFAAAGGAGQVPFTAGAL